MCFLFPLVLCLFPLLFGHGRVTAHFVLSALTSLSPGPPLPSLRVFALARGPFVALEPSHYFICYPPRYPPCSHSRFFTPFPSRN
ncbi:hypothetical protein C8F01DRAFT_1121927 [Mycena amicta]|nr:hypothetical protein C8F01DRAFT_1121927 [Mycena amicta]